MRFTVGAIILLAMLQSAYGASPGERAVAWAESQRDAALGAVVVARTRVDAAETDLTMSRNIERDISKSKDTAALAVVREAITVSEQGIVEAKALLKRALDLLAGQEKTLAAAKSFIAKNGSDATLVIPTKGEVRRVIPGKGSYSTDDIATPLRVGERVEVGPGSSARLFIAGGQAEVALSQNSSFTVTRDDAGGDFEALLAEGMGRIRAQMFERFKHKFEVRTPSYAIAVRGTDFSFSASSSGGRIEVFSGVVVVQPVGSERSVEVHAGEGCDVLKDGGIQPVKPLNNQARPNPWSDHVTPN
jgi:ferric-dicitrate binding protein FerR (iron transport regulator)